MRYILTILAVVLLTTSSCRKDFSTIPSFGKLHFSKDTVFLDTIFTNIGSATYNLKVYNRGNNSITIPKIALEKGTNSNYRLNVDGIPGKEFNNIDILANDSIYVFVETTLDFNSLSTPLYTDRILFDNGNNQQDVDLVTLVQDATFIYPGKDPISMKIDSLSFDGKPTRIKGRFLKDNELTFTKQKPYVIYGYSAVPANKTLTIEAGAKVYFHDNSGLIVDKNASLKINGTQSEKVTFEGDRLEHSFDQVPGQWGTVWMRAGSKENEVNHLQLKNSVIGFLVDSIGSTSTPTLKIKNSEIYNSSSYGILGRETNIEASNVVIGNAGHSSFAGTSGGTYKFTHSTFANYWNNSLRTQPSVFINNFYTYKNDAKQNVIVPKDLHKVNFINCIIEGNNNVEFVLEKVDGSAFNYSIKNCLIKFDDTNKSYENNTELDFTNSNYSNIILNGNPHFKDTSKSEFIIGQNSSAINKAITSLITKDILGVSRILNPDIGAYQHITFE